MYTVQQSFCVCFLLIHSVFCFRKYEWRITAASPGCNNERQASEFELFDTPDGSGGAIPYTGATFSGEGGGGLGSEYPQNLFDGNLATKDCCHVTSATVTFPQDVPNVQAYKWATANDMPCRDPVTWSVWAFDESANTWIELDSQSVSLNLGRYSYTPVFTMASPVIPSSVPTSAPTQAFRPATKAELQAAVDQWCDNRTLAMNVYGLY